MTKQTSLGELEQLLLLAILHQGDDAFAGSIRRHLRDSVGRSVSLGTIYVSLTRLEKKGWVDSWLADPTPVRGGRAKRYYSVSIAGREALQRTKEALTTLWQGVELGAGD